MNEFKEMIQEMKAKNRAKAEAVARKTRPQVERANAHMIKKYGTKWPVGVPLAEQIEYWL